MDNTNPNNPSDPNSNNPFVNPANSPQNLPSTVDNIISNPISTPAQTNTPASFGNDPLNSANSAFAPIPTIPSPALTPTDPSINLNNNVLSPNPYQSNNLNPMTTNQPSEFNTQMTANVSQSPQVSTNPTQAPTFDQSFLTSNPPLTDLNVNPNTTTPDIAISNPTPATQDISSATFNQASNQVLDSGSAGGINPSLNIQPNTMPFVPSAPNMDQIPQAQTGLDIPNNTPPNQPNSPDMNIYNPMIPEQEAPKLAESAPTDLSHLIDPSMNVNGNSPVNTPTLSQQPETLVVPGNGNDGSSTLPTTSSPSHIPKWVIGAGIGLLIIVAGASGYLILGIGKSAPEPASLPAQQQTQLQAPPQTQPQLPNSQAPNNNNLQPNNGSFGELNSSTSSALPPASSQPRSAADLLRQNQQPNQ